MDKFLWLFDHAIFVFSLTVMLSYAVLAVLAALEMRDYKRKNKYTDYDILVASPLAPGVSLIAPAYNEGLNIVDNIKSLLSLFYNNYEVVIVNDGSKDDTLQKMIDAYDLVRCNEVVNLKVPTKPLRGIYRSRNKAFSRLVVVDKVNGGKADALNLGINVSRNNLVACIDVDCILEQYAICKMVKPFMESAKPVIAVGGVIRVANSCNIENGRLISTQVPNEFFPRIQVLEYFRAFLMGRMAWARMDGLMLISGALGLFDKNIMIAAGGYNHKTVGEDMEVVVRMRRYMMDRNLPYTVKYVPDPLCWTEAPVDAKILGRQRNRWTRGTIETLLIHRKMFFNPKYGIIGMLSYPYWFFFEWMAPIVEVLGMFFFLIFAVLGYANWPFALAMIGLIYSYAVLLSFCSILFEEWSFRQYPDWSDLWRLLATAFLEPIFYHPRQLIWAIRGNIDWSRGKNTWGEMVRTGLSAPKPAAK